MKKSILALVALAFMATGCSSSDDQENNPPKPQHTIIVEPGSDARPDWVAPSAEDYEQNMNVYLTLQDELLRFITTKDLICAKIDGEVRGVTVPRQDEGDWLISLIVFSNGAAPIELCYYCDSLHRIYTTDWTTFDAAMAPTGKGDIYEPKFTK